LVKAWFLARLVRPDHDTLGYETFICLFMISSSWKCVLRVPKTNARLFIQNNGTFIYTKQRHIYTFMQYFWKCITNQQYYMQG